MRFVTLFPAAAPLLRILRNGCRAGIEYMNIRQSFAALDRSRVSSITTTDEDADIGYCSSLSRLVFAVR